MYAIRSYYDVEDAQTHMLPTDPAERLKIAQSMAFADWEGLLAELNGHRQRVSRHFEAVFSDPEAGDHPLTGLWLGQLDDDTVV